MGAPDLSTTLQHTDGQPEHLRNHTKRNLVRLPMSGGHHIHPTLEVLDQSSALVLEVPDKRDVETLGGDLSDMHQAFLLISADVSTLGSCFGICTLLLTCHVHGRTRPPVDASLPMNHQSCLPPALRRGTPPLTHLPPERKNIVKPPSATDEVNVTALRAVNDLIRRGKGENADCWKLFEMTAAKP